MTFKFSRTILTTQKNVKSSNQQLLPSENQQLDPKNDGFLIGMSEIPGVRFQVSR